LFAPVNVVTDDFEDDPIPAFSIGYTSSDLAFVFVTAAPDPVFSGLQSVKISSAGDHAWLRSPALGFGLNLDKEYQFSTFAFGETLNNGEIKISLGCVNGLGDNYFNHTLSTISPGSSAWPSLLGNWGPLSLPSFVPNTICAPAPPGESIAGIELIYEIVETSASCDWADTGGTGTCTDITANEVGQCDAVDDGIDSCSWNLGTASFCSGGACSDFNGDSLSCQTATDAGFCLGYDTGTGVCNGPACSDFNSDEVACTGTSGFCTWTPFEAASCEGTATCSIATTSPDCSNLINSAGMDCVWNGLTGSFFIDDLALDDIECGNGVWLSGEECDGSANCVINECVCETGFSGDGSGNCVADPSSCTTAADCPDNVCATPTCIDGVCGENVITGAEDPGQCDLTGLGCDAVECVCSVMSPGACIDAEILKVCGDGFCAPGENCPADVVDPSCTDNTCFEPTCINGCGEAPVISGGTDEGCLSPSSCDGTGVCVAPVCGNGVTETGETCDDGNIISGDGCSDLCQVEPDYTCSGEPSVCTLISAINLFNIVETVGEECPAGYNLNGEFLQRNLVNADAVAEDFKGVISSDTWVALCSKDDSALLLNRHDDCSADPSAVINECPVGYSWEGQFKVGGDCGNPQIYSIDDLGLQMKSGWIQLCVNNNVALLLNVLNHDPEPDTTKLCSDKGSQYSQQGMIRTLLDVSPGTLATDVDLDGMDQGWVGLCSVDVGVTPPSCTSSSDCPDNTCYEPTCIVGVCGQVLVADGGNDESCLIPDSCDGAGACDAAPVCGNGVIETGETCDDGTNADGDGCDDGVGSACTVTSGYTCDTSVDPSDCTLIGFIGASSSWTCDVGGSSVDGTPTLGFCVSPLVIQSDISNDCRIKGGVVNGGSINFADPCTPAQSPPPSFPYQDFCSDTDEDVSGDSRIYNDQGVLRIGELRFEDGCHPSPDENMLREVWCTVGGLANWEDITCSFGCTNGACDLAPSGNCLDTDGGTSPGSLGTKGSATDDVQTLGDSCIDLSNINEAHCVGSVATLTAFSCPAGTECKDDACVTPPIACASDADCIDRGACYTTPTCNTISGLCEDSAITGEVLGQCDLLGNGCDGAQCSCTAKIAPGVCLEVGIVGVDCGNSVIDTDVGETCDDGNTNNNDGCSAACQIESGYECTGEPSVCTIIPLVACTTATVDTDCTDRTCYTTPVCVGGFCEDTIIPDGEIDGTQCSSPNSCQAGNCEPPAGITVKCLADASKGITDAIPIGLQAQGTSSVPNGLIAHYKFDGDVTDPVGNNDGTNNGASFVSGKFGQAANFDGVDDYVQVADDASLDGMSSGMTISLWIKSPSGKSVEEFLVNKYTGLSGSADDDAYVLRLSSGFPKVQIAGGGISLFSVQGSIPVDDNNWNNIIYVWDRPESLLYINGVYDSGATYLEFDSALNDIIDPLYIGAGNKNGAVDNFFNGLIDDVRIYGRALAGAEVRSLSNPPVFYCDPLTETYLSAKANGVVCVGRDYECKSNLCLDGVCTSVKQELEAQGGLLVNIWCFLSTLLPGGETFGQCVAGFNLPEPGPVCGDGVIGGTEVCDDGDTTSGDGCSYVCQIEAGYTCDTSVDPSVCTLLP